MKHNNHWFGNEGVARPGKGHPLLYMFKPALQFDDFPDGGGYPHNFLSKAYVTLGVTDPNKVLHLCSGSMRVGLRVDIRPETQPTVVADCRSTPFANASFDWVMADPPYGESYADTQYRTLATYPKPGQILQEAARLLRPGGRFGILHFLCPMNRTDMKLVGVWGITTGQGYAIRAWSVYEKPAQMRFTDY